MYYTVLLHSHCTHVHYCRIHYSRPDFITPIVTYTIVLYSRFRVALTTMRSIATHFHITSSHSQGSLDLYCLGVWNPMSTHKWRSLTCTCICKLIAMKQRIHRLVSLDRQPRHIPCIMTPVPGITLVPLYTVFHIAMYAQSPNKAYYSHYTIVCNSCCCSPNTTLSTAHSRTSNIEQGICPIPIPRSMLPRQQSNLSFILHSSLAYCVPNNSPLDNCFPRSL